MPEKGEKGWRKHIHTPRPKTPQQTKPSFTALDEGASERRHHQPPDKPEKAERLGWRKTVHNSQPETPIGVNITVTKTASVEEEMDARSEHGSVTPASTPRRRSTPKPTFSRYLPAYLTLTANSKDSVFSEQWSADFPTPFVPLVDPMMSLQAIHSHLCNNMSRPIPMEHHGGLLRVFEDYRKLREKKEDLEVQLNRIIEEYQSDNESWSVKQNEYEAEIRRLELLIAHGTSGMAGLIAARQGTVVKRSRPKQRTVNSQQITASEYISPENLDKQIKMRSRGVLLQRALSPSRRMAALSRQFPPSNSFEEIPIGTPPRHHGKWHGTLSRKTRSELDLVQLGTTTTPPSFPSSLQSDFSGTGDPLPDEIKTTNTTFLGNGVECEAFDALRDLGTLVARRRGLDMKQFVNSLMLLFSDTGEQDKNNVVFESDDEANVTHFPPVSPWEDINNRTPDRRLRRFKSQPQLSSDQRRRRHFSFEPGDDDIGLLREGIDIYHSRMSQPPPSPDFRGSVFDMKPDTSLDRPQTLNAEHQKPSKIPSPIQTFSFGSVRREGSVSSVRRSHLDDQRRDSRSSIVTVIREPRMHLSFAGRSNSSGNLHRSDDRKEHTGSPRIRHNFIALAAARAAESASTSAMPKSDSPASSKVRATRNSTNTWIENKTPDGLC